MALSPSAERSDLTEQERRLLLDIAYRSILSGLDGNPPPKPHQDDLPEGLRTVRDAFVTLHVRGQLNGCIGKMGSSEPLAAVVAYAAWQAAFADPRLPALTCADLDDLHIEVSVLSPQEPMPATSEEELLAHLRPGVDGLVIEADSAHATLLPAVWARCPDPVVFLRLLMRKAGLVPGLWPKDMKAFRYTAFEFGADASGLSV